MPVGILANVFICVNIKFKDTTNNIRKEINSNDLLESVVVILRYIISKTNRKNNKINARDG